MSNQEILKDLETIKDLGIKKTDVFKVGKLKIRLRTVTMEEESIIYHHAQENSNSDYGFVAESKMMTLAFALCEISGKEINSRQEITYDDDNKGILANELYSMIKTWDANITDYCFVKYGELLTKDKKKVNKLIKENK